MFLIEIFVGGNGLSAAPAVFVGARQRQPRFGQMRTVGVVADEFGEEFGGGGVVAGVSEEIAGQLEGVFLIILGPGWSGQEKRCERPEQKAVRKSFCQEQTFSPKRVGSGVEPTRLVAGSPEPES